MSSFALDAAKFEYPLQVGGIRTGTLDAAPGIGSDPAGGRVALVDTGAGLRFTVALSRGGDIIDATCDDTALAFLTPNGLVPPNPAYHTGLEWLRGWPGGLITTCGPMHIGGPTAPDTSLHGRFSNTPAAVTRLHNPDPRRGDLTMAIEMVSRDTRMFGPCLEIRRRIECTLGQPEIRLRDEVINVGNVTAPHHWLYHCNFGYPLVDEGARMIFGGTASLHWESGESRDKGWRTNKVIPGNLAEHAGGGERGFVVDVTPDDAGNCHVGLVNAKRGLAVELVYPKAHLPRLANWQHFGPRGSYVLGLEPYYGSLHHAPTDTHPLVDSTLAPDESRVYELTLRVHRGKDALGQLQRHDGAFR